MQFNKMVFCLEYTTFDSESTGAVGEIGIVISEKLQISTNVSHETFFGSFRPFPRK